MSNLPLADKRLGQHFLKDQKVIDQICQDLPFETQYILEVGPGPGVLTQFLSLHKKPLHVIEKDPRMVEYLKKYITGDQIMVTDALELDLKTYLCHLGWEDHIWLVSNLPYNVGVPLLVRFIQASPIKSMTLMFQKEVGEKIFDFSGCQNSMGSLMALTQNYFDVHFKCPVLPNSFVPPPKVDSIVLGFRRKKDPEIGLEKFKHYESFLRKLFSHRRKQVGGVLKNDYKKEMIEQSLEELGLDRTKRAEVFSLSQVQSLYQKLLGGK